MSPALGRARTTSARSGRCRLGASSRSWTVLRHGSGSHVEQFLCNTFRKRVAREPCNTLSFGSSHGSPAALAARGPWDDGRRLGSLPWHFSTRLTAPAASPTHQFAQL